MPTCTPDPLLLSTIDRLEQFLDNLRLERDREVQLRTRIEEAIETGYEVAYARSGRRCTAAVLPFPDRRRRHLTGH